MLFLEFKDSEVATLDESVLEKWKENWSYKGSRKVITKTITQILEENNIENQIDFMPIDVEGHDFQALKSLDLNKYKPTLILIETHKFDISDVKNNEIVTYLDNYGYDLVGFIVMNCYFKLRA